MDFGPSRTFEERAVRTVDGLSLHVRDYAPQTPATGAPVLCLHGLTRNARDFDVIAPRIASLGRRVIAPDMRGRGRSDYDPDPAHYVPAIYAQDVLTLCDALDVREAVFIGASMGGLITMVVAALAPERVAAAVLNDIGPKLEAAGLARIATYVGQGQPVANWAAAAETARALNGSAHSDKLDDDAFWDAMAHRLFRARDDGRIEFDYDPNIALAFTDPQSGPPVDLTPLFQALADKPVLSVRGALSDILAADGVAHMRSVKADLVSLDVANVGHTPLLDEPEAWDALLDFLARVP